jgi:glycine cleavage system regulatory protein
MALWLLEWRERGCVRAGADLIAPRSSCTSVYRVAINASVSWSAIAGVYDSFTHVDAASELKIIYWATSNYQSKKPATPSAEFSPVTIEFAPPRTNRIFSGVR